MRFKTGRTSMNTLSPSISDKASFEINTSAESTVVIQPRKHLFALDLKAIWEYRELLYFLVWRDLKVHYRQTLIGVGWVILQPLITMVIFTIIFSRFAQIPSDGLPYPVFVYSALLPWNLFAASLNRGTSSVVGNAQLVSKIYFPRLILPFSGVVSPLVDFAVAFVILVGMMILYRTLPSWGILALPLFLLLAVLTALAVGLWLSALNVRYRDIGHTIPFLIQIWMFASPVAYPISVVPEKWRLLYGLNPMVGAIEGFRWALLGNESPDLGAIMISSVMVVALLFS